VRLGALADIHGNFDAMMRAIERHPDVPFWICVGDLASRSGAYPEPPKPLYWIKGNNENFDRIAEFEAGQSLVPNLHFIRNGTAVTIRPGTNGVRSDPGQVRVAGLGGTFAPTWFDTPVADLPHTPRDDKRRHFVREEVEACRQLGPVDILMTHEAARPFILVDEATPGMRPRRRDAGKPAINAVLAALKPRLHLCGHHHRFIETEREGVRSVCIDRVNRSYLLIDAKTFEYEKIDQT
jgi:Icc-related predicted phosphoesterase